MVSSNLVPIAKLGDEMPSGCNQIRGDSIHQHISLVYRFERTTECVRTTKWKTFF